MPPLNDEDARLAGGRTGRELTDIEALLDQLAETSALPGHEGPVRQIVIDQLPDWARDRVETDDIGNVWVSVGPDSEATVFMAHMDEVGYGVESIDADGTVHLDTLGGPVRTAWEGQPAQLQLDPASRSASIANPEQLRGVFQTRSSPDVKRPEAVTAWFGMDGDMLAAAGVKVGMGLTIYKEGHRIGKARYAARSLGRPRRDNRTLAGYQRY